MVHLQVYTPGVHLKNKGHAARLFFFRARERRELNLFWDLRCMSFENQVWFSISSLGQKMNLLWYLDQNSQRSSESCCPLLLVYYRIHHLLLSGGVQFQFAPMGI